MMVRFPDKTSIVRHAADLAGGGNIVDIGCSIGNLFGDRATNVDVRSYNDIINEAKSFHGDIIIPNFIQSDARNLPFKDRTFHIAVLSEILEHLEDPAEVINEAQRVANIIIITVPNEYRWAYDKKPFDRNESGHVQHFTKDALFELVDKCELHLIEFVEIEYGGWAFFILIGVSNMRMVDK